MGLYLRAYPSEKGHGHNSRLGAMALVACLMWTASQPSLGKPALWVGKTLYGEKCQGGHVPGGQPRDYRNRAQFPGTLTMVENTHFTKGVETLTKGATTSAMGDLDFTIRAFPNHHRALNTAVRFSLQHERHPPGEKGLPAECYFQRAIKFSPEDPIPYKLYGYYLHRKGRLQQALQINRQAMELVPNDVMIRYNTGLILVDLKLYDKALEVARPLYEAGLTLPGLKRKLVKAGAWKQSPEEIAAYRKHLQDKAMANAAEAGGDLESDDPADAGPRTGAPGTTDEAAAQDTLGVDSDNKDDLDVTD